ncbi:HU family DNA-binding protein [Streptomyces jumonjinensis]|uniref:HU family DNA-binding protein n=1 Tax=Streptomyces jumonjinensis TaxID=1945 RepID=UPI00188694B0|nr:HU family DNA-binding protein [Streptomyces jumonjinensis]
MNKAQLIEAVATRSASRAEAVRAVENVLDVIVRTVAGGEAVSVTGFGTLVPRRVPARQGRNPQTGQRVMISASRVVRFRPGVRFQDLVSGRRPMPESGNCIQKDPKQSRP